MGCAVTGWIRMDPHSKQRLRRRDVLGIQQSRPEGNHSRREIRCRDLLDRVSAGFFLDRTEGREKSTRGVLVWSGRDHPGGTRRKSLEKVVQTNYVASHFWIS